MPIAAASGAFARHLRTRLEETGTLEGWAVEATTLSGARAKPGNSIALVLWRVQPDQPSGDTSPLRTASQADPPEGTGLKLRYLLVVRGTDAEAEQTMLGRCMATMDQHPVMQDKGSPGALSSAALVVAVETPPDEAYLRLVGACGEPPPLLVPYVVRSIPMIPPMAGRISDRPGTTVS
jgi:hypothetical protein